MNRQSRRCIAINFLASRYKAGALIACAGLFALIGCFGAGFLTYDDSEHIDNSQYINSTSLWDYFVPKVNTTYIPLTFISYKFDRAVHGGWSEKWFGSWAPGVRLDTFLIHACAALFLWRLLARLRFSERRSFFIALIFSCHPIVCETVCWVSERKAAFAALFGFAAMWAQASPRKPVWRWPVACVLYAIALLGKPSALGLLPIMVAIEAFNTVPAVGKRVYGDSNELGSRKPWIESALGLAGLLAITYADFRVNMFTHSADIVTPPGGSVFTALLTDLEIFSRYLFNLAFPYKLSAVYAVVPIVSLGDPRVWLYGGALLVVVAGTTFLARNRWRALFGWLWFFAALAPNSNVIAIGHIMQDRYVYLSIPGFLMAASEAIAGIVEKFVPVEIRSKATSTVAIVFVIACITLTTLRGFVWRSTGDVFLDAAIKQPQAFYAHYGLGGVLYQEYRNAAPGSKESKLAHDAWVREFTVALKCPDNSRYSWRTDTALYLGEDAFAKHDWSRAADYLAAGAEKNRDSPDRRLQRALSLAYLSALEDIFRRPESALEKARESLRVEVTEQGQFALARAAISMSKKNPSSKDTLLDEARDALSKISPNSDMQRDIEALRNELK